MDLACYLTVDLAGYNPTPAAELVGNRPRLQNCQVADPGCRTGWVVDPGCRIVGYHIYHGEPKSADRRGELCAPTPLLSGQRGVEAPDHDGVLCVHAVLRLASTAGYQ